MAVQGWSMLCAWLNLPKEKDRVKDRGQETPICGRFIIVQQIAPFCGRLILPCPTDVRVTLGLGSRHGYSHGLAWPLVLLSPTLKRTCQADSALQPGLQQGRPTELT